MHKYYVTISMTKNYSDLTVREILALAASDISDDNQLAVRFAKRLTLEIKRQLGTAREEDMQWLASLVEVTDQAVFHH
jgi:hypothetical protein